MPQTPCIEHRAGQEKRLSFKHARGFARYQARFDVLFANGTKQNFTTTFVCTRTRSPGVEICNAATSSSSLSEKNVTTWKSVFFRMVFVK